MSPTRRVPALIGASVNDLGDNRESRGRAIHRRAKLMQGVTLQ
jgi:hypothetical protein